MACVLHRLEMGQQCHLRASPPWPQMHLLGSEPSRWLRNPISTLFLFTGKRQKPPLWIMKETARSYFQRGWRKGFWGNLGEQVRGSGGEAEPGETPPKEALCAQPTQGSEVRGSFYRVGALKVWAPDLLQCFTWELVRDTSPRAPPHTCRIRTSGVGHSTLGFTKGPPQEIQRQARVAERLDQACWESEPWCGRRGLGPGDFRASPSICPSSVQFSSVAQSCLTLCDPMNRSRPGLPVHQQLPEFTQTHVHRVGDAIQPSHPLSSPSPPAFSLSQHQGLFQ